MPLNTKQEGTRVFAYDLLRIIAIFSVISIHTIGGFVSGPYSVTSSEFILGNIFVGFARIGVPIFVMLSGALLLNEEKDLPIKKLAKRILHLFILFILWSVFYAFFHQIVLPIYKGESISTTGFFKACIDGHYHLWYLPMIIGLYMITPILRLFIKKQNHKYILYFIILGLCFQFFSTDANYFIKRWTGKNLISSYLDKFQLTGVKNYITYYLLGWYITNIPLKKIYRKVIYILGALSALFIVVGMQFFSTNESKEYSFFYNETSLHVLLYAVAVFIFIYYLFRDKESPKCHSIIEKLSALSFGVYLLHVLILEIPDMFLQTNNVYLQIPLNWILTTVISFALIWIISKIPVVKNLIK